MKATWTPDGEGGCQDVPMSCFTFPDETDLQGTGEGNRVLMSAATLQPMQNDLQQRIIAEGSEPLDRSVLAYIIISVYAFGSKEIQLDF